MSKRDKRILIISTWLALSFAAAGVFVRDIKLWLLIIEATLGMELIVVMMLLFAAMERDSHE